MIRFLAFIIWTAIAIYVYFLLKDVDTKTADVLIFAALIPLALIVGSLVWEKGQEYE